MAQEYRQHVSTLREVFLDQVRILGSALALHKRLIPKEFNALHEHLETMYARLKRGIKETGSPNMNRQEQSITRSNSPGIVTSNPENSQMLVLYRQPSSRVIVVPQTYVIKHKK
ncbi:hypothetical protein CAPTEDRAFT_208933 [Capitella teleta]|uniref:DOCKER domain-containing protein n=1 Tax=Capitella teleta TaxID=283909 RepID=R7TS81_CAPTE|nr:hypothetical protein CAPTEDRAFT_208933 [Capitella teleta]|eukprot:ELT93875.1 hypothetical protein CAPTEDRAFT_208933 [Capitella teleta]